MDLKSHLERLKKAIDGRLDSYLAPDKGIPDVLNKAMRYGVLASGKRLRPILTLEVCKICGGSVADALPAACAIEMIHAYSLVHDDLPSMDNDDYRRGRPSCHRVFGDANAILSGDALIPLAFNIISEKLIPRIAAKVTRELSEAIGAKGMVAGQVLDLEYKGKKKNKIILERINRIKTARLFETSAKCGAMAADASPRKIKSAGEFGCFLGMAYQITDDILDGGDYVKLFGDVRSRKDAFKFSEWAKSRLDIFGKKAGTLKAIVDYILRRDN